MLNSERFWKLLMCWSLSSGGALTTSTSPMKITLWLLGAVGGWGQPSWERILPGFLTQARLSCRKYTTNQRTSLKSSKDFMSSVFCMTECPCVSLKGPLLMWALSLVSSVKKILHSGFLNHPMEVFTELLAKASIYSRAAVVGILNLLQTLLLDFLSDTSLLLLLLLTSSQHRVVLQKKSYYM